jgi:hypothetical protein
MRAQRVNFRWAAVGNMNHDERTAREQRMRPVKAAFRDLPG